MFQPYYLRQIIHTYGTLQIGIFFPNLYSTDGYQWISHKSFKLIRECYTQIPQANSTAAAMVMEVFMGYRIHPQSITKQKVLSPVQKSDSPQSRTIVKGVLGTVRTEAYSRYIPPV